MTLAQQRDNIGSGAALPWENGVIPVPVLVKGQVRSPHHLSRQDLTAALEKLIAHPGFAGESCAFTLGGNNVVAQLSGTSNTDARHTSARFLLTAKPDPRELIESDMQQLSRDLMSLPFQEVLDYLGCLQQVLREQKDEILQALANVVPVTAQYPGEFDLLMQVLPELLDREGIEQAVDFELSLGGIRGREFLDRWVSVKQDCYQGVTGRIGDQIFSRSTRPSFSPQVRACPTRQLHITAGNSPFVPFISWLRGTTTRGALVVKSATESPLLAAVMATAIGKLDAAHPLRRHTSLVHWKGGDAKYEEQLFGPGAFDRVVVWGSEAAIRSVHQRSLHAKTVVFRPRYSVSLIGTEATSDRLSDAAELASTDSMISNQQACVSSLVHYVVGDEQHAIRYCEQLRDKLARWDQQWPRVLQGPLLGQLRMLKRTALLHGRWFENGVSPNVTSAVVLAARPFDIARHPACRLVIVRQLDRAEDVLPYLSGSVSSLGVYGRETLAAIRDASTVAGVTSVMSLGESESVYPGMPNDGMRALSELVNWSSCVQADP
ncbi:MAG: acyl-CoA reductase [Rubripirellula sp.]